MQPCSSCRLGDSVMIIEGLGDAQQAIDTRPVRAQLVLEQLVLTGDVAARRRLARDAISSAHEAVSRQVTALKKARKLEGRAAREAERVIALTGRGDTTGAVRAAAERLATLREASAQQALAGKLMVQSGLRIAEARGRALVEHLVVTGRIPEARAALQAATVAAGRARQLETTALRVDLPPEFSQAAQASAFAVASRPLSEDFAVEALGGFNAVSLGSKKKKKKKPASAVKAAGEKAQAAVKKAGADAAAAAQAIVQAPAQAAADGKAAAVQQGAKTEPALNVPAVVVEQAAKETAEAFVRPPGSTMREDALIVQSSSGPAAPAAVAKYRLTVSFAPAPGVVRLDQNPELMFVLGRAAQPADGPVQAIMGSHKVGDSDVSLDVWAPSDAIAHEAAQRLASGIVQIGHGRITGVKSAPVAEGSSADGPGVGTVLGVLAGLGALAVGGRYAYKWLMRKGA